MVQIMIKNKDKIPNIWRKNHQKTVYLVSEKTILSASLERTPKILYEGELKEKSKVSVGGKKHTVRTADKQILRLKLITTTCKFQKSRVRERDIAEHTQIRRIGGEKSQCVADRKTEKGSIAESLTNAKE